MPRDEKEQQLADTCNDLFRACEHDSSAQEAYDNAFEEAVTGGFGAFRVIADYEDEESEDNLNQVVKIEPIYDAGNTVFFDHNSKKYDKSDAEYAFVITTIDKDKFIEEYGEDRLSDIGTATGNSYFNWRSIDVVSVAEYYVVEKKKDKLYIFSDITGEETRYKEQDFKDNEDLLDELEAKGYTLETIKKIKTKKVRKYIINKSYILEDCGYISGKNIPVIPVYGKRWFIDGIERYMGHVRLAKDAQRLKNMSVSKLGEISALSSIEKPILSPEQIQGHELLWANDNNMNNPYLLINPIQDQAGNDVVIGVQSYTRAPNIPPATAGLLQLLDQDIKEILGNTQMGEQIVSNISGKAVEMIQTKLDMQTFIYMDNMSKSMKRCGQVWISIAKDVYIEESRKVKTLNSKNNTMKYIQLVTPTYNEETMGFDYENDLAKADFDVFVDVAPSTSTKRASTVRAITGLMQVTTDQETMQVLSSIALMNMEGEGLSDARGYFRDKLIKMGVVKPNEEELKKLQAELANKEPDAQTQYIQAEAIKAEALSEKAKADTILTLAKAEETGAKTAKTLSEIDNKEEEDILNLMKEITSNKQEVKELVPTPPLTDEIITR